MNILASKPPKKDSKLFNYNYKNNEIIDIPRPKLCQIGTDGSYAGKTKNKYLKVQQGKQK